MKERPITFTVPEVRAILQGRKTQTRLLVAKKLSGWYGKEAFNEEHLKRVLLYRCKYETGDRLWVRETWSTEIHNDGDRMVGYRATDTNEACVDCPKNEYQQFDKVWNSNKDSWRPGIIMPRWASRITLGITDVRVERLQDISETDAISEGTEGGGAHPDFWVGAFAEAWDANHKSSHAWETNPWVWVITFKLEGNARDT